MSGRGAAADVMAGAAALPSGPEEVRKTEQEPGTAPGPQVTLRAQAPGMVLEYRAPCASGGTQWLPLPARLELDPHGRPLAVRAAPDPATARHEEMLARALRLLDSPLDLEDTVWQTAELAVDGLADWCLVEAPGADQVRRCAVDHRDPGRLDLAQRVRLASNTRQLLGLMSRLPAGAVVELEALNLDPDTPEDGGAATEGPGTVAGAGLRSLLAELGATTAVTVPLATAGRPIGSMLLLTCEGRRLTAADVDLAVELGRRAGSALEKARLHGELQASVRALQASLLPPLPVVPGVRLSAHHRPGTTGSDIGGDYYDVFRTDHDRWWVTLGDVCGKGPSAAALSSAVRHLLHGLAHGTDDPSVVLRRLNDVLLAQGWDDRFTTLSLLTFRDDAGTGALPLSVASGGQPDPLVRGADGSVRTVRCPGMLVGALPELAVETVPLLLPPGETLLLHTDGVSEARDPGGAELGEGTLAMLLAARDGRAVEDLAGELAFEVLKLVDGELRDDLALLTLTR